MYNYKHIQILPLPEVLKEKVQTSWSNMYDPLRYEYLNAFGSDDYFKGAIKQSLQYKKIGPQLFADMFFDFCEYRSNVHFVKRKWVVEFDFIGSAKEMLYLCYSCFHDYISKRNVTFYFAEYQHDHLCHSLDIKRVMTNKNSYCSHCKQGRIIELLNPLQCVRKYGTEMHECSCSNDEIWSCLDCWMGEKTTFTFVDFDVFDCFSYNFM